MSVRRDEDGDHARFLEANREREREEGDRWGRKRKRGKEERERKLEWWKEEKRVMKCQHETLDRRGSVLSSLLLERDKVTALSDPSARPAASACHRLSTFSEKWRRPLTVESDIELTQTRFCYSLKGLTDSAGVRCLFCRAPPSLRAVAVGASSCHVAPVSLWDMRRCPRILVPGFCLSDSCIYISIRRRLIEFDVWRFEAYCTRWNQCGHGINCLEIQTQTFWHRTEIPIYDYTCHIPEEYKCPSVVSKASLYWQFSVWAF